MSAQLARRWAGHGRRRLTLPTAPSPVTTHWGQSVRDQAGVQARARGHLEALGCRRSHCGLATRRLIRVGGRYAGT